MERLVKFELLGQEFPLYTDATEEDVEEILALVKSQLVVNNSQSTHVLPPNKLAILSSLNMASMYVKLKKEYDQYKLRVEEYSARLMQKIEDTL